MWCKHCQQDVPGLFSADAAGYRCPRCAAELSDAATEPGCEMPTEQTASEFSTDRTEGGAEATASEAPPPYDGWELEQRLRHIERVLRIDQGVPTQCGGGSQHHRIRLDAAHAETAGWHYGQSAKAKASRKPAARASRASSWLPVLTWTVLGLGLMAFTCGGGLLVWSTVTGREDLWTIGMPVALGGQIVLVIGLILQLDRLWHDSRDTAQKLHHVDRQLHDLNTAATLLGAGPGTGSGSFHSHLAGGASPQLLLADLKSQLDRLAVRLAQVGP